MPILEFTDEKLQPEFKAEQNRLTKAITEAEKTEALLNDTMIDLNKNANRVKGALSSMIRCSEQLTATRNYKLSLIKELRNLKKDVVDRSLKITEKSMTLDIAKAGSEVNSLMLNKLQEMLIVPKHMIPFSEPIDVSDVISTKLDGDNVYVEDEEDLSDEATEVLESEDGEEVADVEEPEETPELPEDINDGDTFSDENGNLFVLNNGSAEALDANAAKVVISDDEDKPSYAKLKNGTFVLVALVE